MKKLQKYLMLFAVAILTLSVNVFAQDDQLDKLPFDDEPLRETTVPYFAIGGGFIGDYFFAKVDDINLRAKSLGIADLKAPIFQTGGQGFSGIPWVPNTRIGVIALGGSAIQEEKGTSMLKSFEYSTSYIGLSLDYGFIVTKGLAVLPGATIGWSGATIEYTESPTGVIWDSIGTNANSSKNITRLKSSGFYIQPNVNVEYALTNFFMVRASAGYSIQLSKGDWTLNKDNNNTVSNVPSSISNSGVHAQLGIFLGLFNY